MKTVRSDRITGLFQRICPRPIEAKTEGNSESGRPDGPGKWAEISTVINKAEMHFYPGIHLLKISLKGEIQNTETALCATVCINNLQLFIIAKGCKQVKYSIAKEQLSVLRCILYRDSYSAI